MVISFLLVDPILIWVIAPLTFLLVYRFWSSIVQPIALARGFLLIAEAHRDIQNQLDPSIFFKVKSKLEMEKRWEREKSEIEKKLEDQL